MTTIEKENFDLTNVLTRRYATKKFDSSRKLDDATYRQLENSLLLSASSFGLQPWKFVFVTDPEIKAQLPAFSWGQNQPQDCSHLVVICRISELNEEHIDRYIQKIASTRGVTLESLESYSGMMKGFLKSPSDKIHWMEKQCYIALGTLLTAAAALGVDACPMEGFDAKAYDQILGLSEKGCHSVVVCPLGYRAEDDHYAKLAKVRFDAEDIVIKI
ncbi:MAG: nitroreductase family protein [Cyanobacteria bacterium TGS_CYA1]|nr:nitroreductase family protein [Cyanobacteria bacterium TGS_CYA1]